MTYTACSIKKAKVRVVTKRFGFGLDWRCCESAFAKAIGIGGRAGSPPFGLEPVNRGMAEFGPTLAKIELTPVLRRQTRTWLPANVETVAVNFRNARGVP